MNEEKYYNDQVSYFGKEFRSIKKYELLPWQRSYIKRIKNNLIDRNFKDQTLVDIGAGSGYVTIEVAKLGMKTIAIDLTPAALENIKRYKKKFGLKKIQLIHCKGDEIPIRSNGVDYVVANAVLEHIPNEKGAAKEWKRILKPGGRLFVTVPLRYRFILPPFIPINYLHDKRMGHLRRYDLESLRSLFGMEVIKVSYTGHFIKMFGYLINILLKSKKLDQTLEKVDKNWEHRRYGATNIIVILRKR